MYGVILTAHGTYAEGLYSGLKLITGGAENIRLVNFVEGDGFEDIDGKLQKAIDELKTYDGLLILTDLAGGTPFNRSVMLTENLENAFVFAGMNFQMAYTAANAEDGLDSIESLVLEEAKNGIVSFSKARGEADDEDGEGI